MSYSVEPWFWGNAFPLQPDDHRFPSHPYDPQQFAEALRSIASQNYFSRIKGADQVFINPPSTYSDPWPAGSNGFVATFTSNQVVDFIKRRLDQNPPPLSFVTRIILVVIPQGSVLDIGALGAHQTLKYKDNSIIWAWMYASNNVNDAMRVATHEIAEAIGEDGGAPEELCDDCAKANPNGAIMPGGLTVETYKDLLANKCIAPGAFGYGGRPIRPVGILFHSTDNSSQIWFMDGSHIRRRSPVLAENGITAVTIGPPWSVLGIGEFGADLGVGILFGSSDRSTQFWFMDSERIRSRVSVVAEDGITAVTIGPPWSVQGFGNFGVDHGVGILFRSADNSTQIWLMDGNRILARLPVVAEDGKTAVTIGPPWSVLGVADFGADQGNCILFRSSDNSTQIWSMDGNRIRARMPIVAEDGKTAVTIGPPWSVLGIGDFGAGQGTGILFRSSDNSTQIWFMDGNRIRARAPIVSEDGKTAVTIRPPWSVLGVF